MIFPPPYAWIRRSYCHCHWQIIRAKYSPNTTTISPVAYTIIKIHNVFNDSYLFKKTDFKDCRKFSKLQTSLHGLQYHMAQFYSQAYNTLREQKYTKYIRYVMHIAYIIALQVIWKCRQILIYLGYSGEETESVFHSYAKNSHAQFC